MVFEPAFCDQSRNTLPPRRALVIVAVHQLGVLALELLGDLLGQRGRLVGGQPLRQVGVQVQALAAAGDRSRVETALGQLVAHQQRDLAALVQARRLAGVEVDDQPVGVARLAVAADRPLVDVQLEGGEVGQPGQRGEVVDDREDQRVARDDWAREPVVGTFAVRTQDGVPAGVFFSKKLESWTPCGQRIRVTQRSSSCGSSTGETWA